MPAGLEQALLQGSGRPLDCLQQDALRAGLSGLSCAACPGRNTGQAAVATPEGLSTGDDPGWSSSSRASDADASSKPVATPALHRCEEALRFANQ